MISWSLLSACWVKQIFMTFQHNMLCEQLVSSSQGNITRPTKKEEKLLGSILRILRNGFFKNIYPGKIQVISKISSPGMINTNGVPQTLMKQFYQKRFSIALFFGWEISFLRQHTIIQLEFTTASVLHTKTNRGLLLRGSFDSSRFFKRQNVSLICQSRDSF